MYLFKNIVFFVALTIDDSIRSQVLPIWIAIYLSSSLKRTTREQFFMIIVELDIRIGEAYQLLAEYLRIIIVV